MFFSTSVNKHVCHLRKVQKVLKLKSVEFLITIGLLLSLFSWLYTSFNELNLTAKEKLKTFNESLKIRKATSLINQMIVYGEPFEIKGLTFDPSLAGLTKDIFSGRYNYETYSRW